MAIFEIHLSQSFWVDWNCMYVTASWEARRFSIFPSLIVLCWNFSELTSRELSNCHWSICAVSVFSHMLWNNGFTFFYILLTPYRGAQDTQVFLLHWLKEFTCPASLRLWKSAFELLEAQNMPHLITFLYVPKIQIQNGFWIKCFPLGTLKSC